MPKMRSTPCAGQNQQVSSFKSRICCEYARKLLSDGAASFNHEDRDAAEQVGQARLPVGLAKLACSQQTDQSLGKHGFCGTD